MAKTPSMWDADESVDSFFNRVWQIDSTTEPVVEKA